MKKRDDGVKRSKTTTPFSSKFLILGIILILLIIIITLFLTNLPKKAVVGEAIGASCTTNNDCASTEICTGGFCEERTCQSNSNCLSGQQCIAGVCEVVTCQSNCGPCVGDTDCSLGQQCVAGTCNNDIDRDSITDGSDNCPSVSNPQQQDLDNDGIGDICDSDADGDGVNEIAFGGTDNCPSVANPLQTDSNNNGIGDACDALAFCGDGLISAAEPCDDGNTASGDGCSRTCIQEFGYTCSGVPSACFADDFVLYHSYNIGVARDETPNQQNGQVSGATASSLNPIDQGYFSFDGSNDVITVLDNNLLDLTGAITLSAWIKPSSFVSGTIIAKSGSYALYLDSNGQLVFELTDGPSRSLSSVSYDYGGLKKDANWHLVTARWDGTTSAAGQQILVDRSIVAGRAAAVSLLAATTTNLAVGALQTAPLLTTNYYRGNIDDVRLYRRALTSTEIAQLYNAFVLVCGNNIVDAGETCDDGNAVGGDGCSATCISECGDGAWDRFATLGNPYSEQCDDGNTASGDGCSVTCTSECGDGVWDRFATVGNPYSEQCDDGNTAAGDGCSAICTSECGDGLLDRVYETGVISTSYTEQCDRTTAVTSLPQVNSPLCPTTATTCSTSCQCVSSVTAVICGDADNNGNVNVLDVLAAINHIIGRSTLPDTNVIDVNNDVFVNIIDVLKIIDEIINPASTVLLC